MWNRSISLPTRKVTEQNENGFRKEHWEFIRGIPASLKDATRQDEIVGNQSGYQASVIAEIMACNYNGGSFFVDEATGDIYDIRRTFRSDKSMMTQLTGERREHGTI